MTRDLLEDSTQPTIIIDSSSPVGSWTWKPASRLQHLNREIRAPQGAARCNVGVCPFAHAEADATLPA